MQILSRPWAVLNDGSVLQRFRDAKPDGRHNRIMGSVFPLVYKTSKQWITPEAPTFVQVNQVGDFDHTLYTYQPKK